MKKVYLDTSVYNCIYDDQTQSKIFLETQAVKIILHLIDFKKLESVNSSVLEYENNQNPFPIKKQAIKQYLEKATFKQLVDETIRQKARNLEQQGIKPIDALHVACFETSESDYFITCDQKLLNRCKTLSIKALNPIDFIQELDNEN